MALWAVGRSLLLDRVTGTTYRSTCAQITLDQFARSFPVANVTGKLPTNNGLVIDSCVSYVLLTSYGKVADCLRR